MRFRIITIYILVENNLRFFAVLYLSLVWSSFNVSQQPSIQNLV